MKLSFGNTEVRDNDRISPSLLSNPPVVDVDFPIYTILLFQTDTKYVHWYVLGKQDSKQEEILSYQRPFRNTNFTLMVLSGNHPVQLTRTNLPDHKISEFYGSEIGRKREILHFSVSGLSALPQNLQNLITQNLTIPEAYNYCQSNPSLCTVEVWKFFANRLLTDDPVVKANDPNGEERVNDLKYLGEHWEELLETGEIRKFLEEGYEKLVPYWNPRMSEFDEDPMDDERYILINEHAGPENYTYLVREILARWPNYDLSVAFSDAAAHSYIDLLKIYFPILTGTEEDLENSRDMINDYFLFNFEEEYETSEEWINLFLPFVTNETIERVLALPTVTDLAIQKQLRNELNRRLVGT